MQAAVQDMILWPKVLSGAVDGSICLEKSETLTNKDGLLHTLERFEHAMFVTLRRAS